ncbi:UNVERIFIED_CONTAM: hypothetical protein HDU68_001612 [Siphonaria sp. JEL0065]|nr:hypothetical protein HDU68_001612 [Siphonaria sp. JEL0065]
MSRINEKLSKFKTLKDFSPLIRSILLQLYFFGGLVPIMLKFKVLALVWWSFGIAILGFAIVITYFRPGAVNKFLRTQIQTFNDQDEALILQWKLLPLAETLPVFAWNWKDVGIQIEWTIVIRHVLKDAQEMEFLPPYLSGDLMIDVESCELEDEFVTTPVSASGKPPSYRSVL